MNVYNLGYNRIFYESNTSVGKVVELEILYPNLSKSNKLIMIPIDDIFYIDIYFNQYGSHYIKIFENGVHKDSKILVVTGGSSGLIVYPQT